MIVNLPSSVFSQSTLDLRYLDGATTGTPPVPRWQKLKIKQEKQSCFFVSTKSPCQERSGARKNGCFCGPFDVHWELFGLKTWVLCTTIFVLFFWFVPISTLFWSKTDSFEQVVTPWDLWAKCLFSGDSVRFRAIWSDFGRFVRFPGNHNFLWLHFRNWFL